MPALENPRHEEFALQMARGVKQGEAYIRAGYTENKSAASKLANSPRVQDRVEELRRDLMKRVDTALAVPTADNMQSLKEMGLTMEWVASQYRLIYEQSLQAGSFSAANSAVDNIRKLIEAEQTGKNGEDADNAPTFNMNQMLGVLDKVADIVAASKESEAPALPKDVTPEDEL